VSLEEELHHCSRYAGFSRSEYPCLSEGLRILSSLGNVCANRRVGHSKDIVLELPVAVYHPATLRSLPPLPPEPYPYPAPDLFPNPHSPSPLGPIPILYADRALSPLYAYPSPPSPSPLPPQRQHSQAHPRSKREMAAGFLRTGSPKLGTTSESSSSSWSSSSPAAASLAPPGEKTEAASPGLTCSEGGCTVV
jgi:hypothetical protein